MKQNIQRHQLINPRTLPIRLPQASTSNFFGALLIKSFMLLPVIFEKQNLSQLQNADGKSLYRVHCSVNTF